MLKARPKLRRFIFEWWPFITLSGYFLGLVGFGLFMSILFDLSDSTNRLAKSVSATNVYILNVKEDLDKTDSKANINTVSIRELRERVRAIEELLTPKAEKDALSNGGRYIVREYIIEPKKKSK